MPSPPRSPKLHGRKASLVRHVLQLQLLVALTLCVEIDSADVPRDLVEADVIETFEACAGDLPHAMVGHKEGFLPAHEDVFALEVVFVVEVWFLGLFSKGAPGGKAGPVLHVGFVGGAPGGMVGLEGVFGANDFAGEIGGECWMV